MNIKWSSRDLSKNYDRTLVGFDFRTTPSPYNPPRSAIEYLGNWYDKKTIRATVDGTVWPSVYDIRESRYSNEYGLANRCDELDIIVEKSRSGSLPSGVVTAFDMPTSWVDFDQNRKTHRNSALCSEYFKTDYRFVGFDIVDAWGFIDGSALYSFDWNVSEIEAILQEASVELNEWGLSQDSDESIRLSLQFDKFIPEHAPFTPCGIWLSEC